jgi:hypothetical protein
VHSHVRDAVGGAARLPPTEALAQGNPRVLPGAREAFLTGYTDALNQILVIGGAVALLGAIAALVLVHKRDFVRQGA